jgi:hypothetical protein
MQSHILTPGRATLLLVATGAFLVAGCHSNSNPVMTGCPTKKQAQLDSAKTAADSGRILAQQVPEGGTGC